MGRGAIQLGLLVALALAPTASAQASSDGSAQFDPGEPATRAGRKVLRKLEQILANLRTTEYRHGTVVRQRAGHYGWDCSGMANWILKRVAPHAYGAINRKRPVAWSYWRVIGNAPTHRPRRGWQRVADIAAVLPGDVFAWRRPPHWPKGGNTGHVGFVLARPQPLPDVEGAFTVRVADATSLPHQDDTRDADGPGGFGHGTLLFMTDASGDAYAYGWFGARSRGVIPTDIVFGRLYR